MIYQATTEIRNYCIPKASKIRLPQPLFMQALAGQKTDTTPVWFMRQAGRYMASYRKLREKHDLLTIVRNPELACEVTLQPIQAFDLDAAIIFSDILPLLCGMGLRLQFVKDEGPVIENPISNAKDISQLATTSPLETMAPTLQAIAMVRRDLAPHIPLLGFSGAPFTLASYAIEGGASKNFTTTKTFMYNHPQLWHELMLRLSYDIGTYLAAQAEAGAQAVQLFDSWAGILSPEDYVQYVLPYTRRSIEIAKKHGTPVIYFSTATWGILAHIKNLPCDAWSFDWRVSIDDAWRAIGTNRVIQGNLDPAILLSSFGAVAEKTKTILASAAQAKASRAGFIFNLGHGILQHTPEDNVRRLVDYVHEHGSN